MQTALIASAWNKKPHVVEWLLLVGANTTLANKFGSKQQTALQWARDRGNDEIVTMLVMRLFWLVLSVCCCSPVLLIQEEAEAKEKQVGCVCCVCVVCVLCVCCVWVGEAFHSDTSWVLVS